MAFCSYNLSSILNGLVYFDQFDRLSQKQLGLVIAGIVILLVGVGAVSIQDDTDGELERSIVEGDWVAAENVAISPPLSPGHPRRSASHVTPSQRSFTDLTLEGERILLSPSPRKGAPRRAVSSPSSFPSEAARSALSIVAEESRDLQERLVQSEYQADALTTTRSRTASGLTHPPLRTPSTSLPRARLIRRGTFLSPRVDGEGEDGDAANVPGPPLPGFTIGLSPISPGFSLVPRHREPSSATHDDGENGAGRMSASEIINGDDDTARPRRRRWSALKNMVVGRQTR